MIDKLKEMLEMQHELDQAIFEKHGTSYKDLLEKKSFYYAIADELGELNHAKKSEWCWWKESQEPTDRKKELEEFADALHFCLSHDLALFSGQIEEMLGWLNTSYKLLPEDTIQCDPIFDLLEAAKRSWINHYSFTSVRALHLATELGYTPEEIYEAYKEKNRINYERLNNGY